MKTYASNSMIKSATKIEGVTSIDFNWSSLLAYLDLDHLFQDYPVFDSSSPLFGMIVGVIAANPNKDELFYLFEKVFVECLVKVKSLHEVDAVLLLEKIRLKKQTLNPLFSAALDKYETYLTNDRGNAMHDLILYLAWDRVCVDFKSLFEKISPHTNNAVGLTFLQECLAESFQHIYEQKRTQPGFYRLAEALSVCYQKIDHLNVDTQSYLPANFLADILYVDVALLPKAAAEQMQFVSHANIKEIGQRQALALVVQSRLVEKLNWPYQLQSVTFLIQ